MTSSSCSSCLLLWTLLLVCCAAQPHCDPVTQYEEAGRCCTKCGPGTSMVPSSPCLQPQCSDCRMDEYQESFTSATSCQRQPYCDPNKNFQEAVHQSVRRRSLCLCRRGFHCSSEACLTCVPHRECPPGSGAQTPGNHSHDSVCEECPTGSFSSHSSWEEACQEWRRCGDGFKLQQEGSRETDALCAPQRTVLITICIILSVLVLILILSAVLWHKQRGKRGYYYLKAKSCCAWPLGAPAEGPAEAPRDEEKVELRMPVENEDQNESSDLQLTFDGNYVAQEDGKMEVLSRQESQPQQEEGQ